MDREPFPVISPLTLGDRMNRVSQAEALRRREYKISVVPSFGGIIAASQVFCSNGVSEHSPGSRTEWAHPGFTEQTQSNPEGVAQSRIQTGFACVCVVEPFQGSAHSDEPIPRVARLCRLPWAMLWNSFGVSALRQPHVFRRFWNYWISN